MYNDFKITSIQKEVETTISSNTKTYHRVSKDVLIEEGVARYYEQLLLKREIIE